MLCLFSWLDTRTWVKWMRLQTVNNMMITFHYHNKLSGLAIPNKYMSTITSTHNEIITPEGRFFYLEKHFFKNNLLYNVTLAKLNSFMCYSLTINFLIWLIVFLMYPFQCLILTNLIKWFFLSTFICLDKYGYTIAKKNHTKYKICMKCLFSQLVLYKYLLQFNIK